MRTARRVVETPEVEVRVVECSDEDTRWSPPEPGRATEVVLVHRGLFQVSARGGHVLADPTSGYLQHAGEEARFRHPAGGDRCTAITLRGDHLLEGLERSTSPAVRVDARLELAHRLLLRSGDDPDFAALESVVDLLRLARRSDPHERPAPGRHSLAERAREALVADHGSSGSLVALAGELGTSPDHLSRTFSHHVGMSISRYRNRLRVSRALQRLDEGEIDLVDLAVALGFADQSHLTRVMRRELGSTPGRVRELLSA